MASRMPYSAKSWKPNLVVPVEDPQYWKMRMDFIRDITFPRGSVRVVSVKVLGHSVREKINELVNYVFQKTEENLQISSEEQREEDLNKLIQPLKDEGILAGGRHTH